jgi:chromosome partitioning protein
MKSIAVLGGKGGTTKTATSHLLCLGAQLQGTPACYVLTDPLRKVRAEGRHYAVLDGRAPEQLAVIFSSRDASLNGWLIIDGGGNRPEFDKRISENVDLTVIPFRASEEDIDTVAESLSSLPHSLAWPTAWPTNPFAINTARYLLDGLSKAFPQRIIEPPIPFINSISDLLALNLVAPSTPVRAAARKAFAIMSDYYNSHRHAAQNARQQPRQSRHA